MRKLLIAVIPVVALTLTTSTLFAQGRPGPRPVPNPNQPEPRPNPNNGDPVQPNNPPQDPNKRPEPPKRPGGDREFKVECNDNDIRAAVLAFMREHDANKDGFIQADEFGAADERGERLFKELDKNNDGKLGKEELVPFARHMVVQRKCNEILDREVRNLLQNFDRNKDGKIQADEWGRERREAFERADVNKDGVLDGDELRHVARFIFEQRNGRLPLEEPKRDPNQKPDPKRDPNQKPDPERKDERQDNAK